MNKLLTIVLFCAMAVAMASPLRATAAVETEPEDEQPTENRQLWGSSWGRPRQEPDSIADIAGSTRALRTLTSLLEAADLVDVLDGDGPFTVFAPTNRAFRALDDATVAFLQSEEGKADLTGILTYHVLGESVRFFGRSPTGPLTTLNGATVDVSAYRGGRMGPWVKKVNDATIVMSNIKASNGIVHIIDAVLLPPVLLNTTETP